jgi:hypothetical protein
MERRSRHRIERIEEHLSAARKERDERRKQSGKQWRPQARRHAIAVAAIVLSGQPKIDEPLNRAWARALQHYGINPNKIYDLSAATDELSPLIMSEENKSARFTEIFLTAPVWLLQFTGLAMDSRFLEFQLPDISETLSWGSAGYDDARRWPKLPSGMMTAGDPIPHLDERWLWIIIFCEITVPIAGFPEDLFRQDKETRSRSNKDPLDPVIEDILFALELDKKPEEELSRYEKRRMRKVAEWASRL